LVKTLFNRSIAMNAKNMTGIDQLDRLAEQRIQGDGLIT
jgi:hypothetical protein